MNIESIHALRRANPRANDGFVEAVEAVAGEVAARVTAEPVSRSPRRSLRVPAFASLAAAAVAAAALTVGWPGRSSGVESATAAVRKAATVTAASAERSGTAVVRITHDGELWAGSTVRWNRGDLAVSRDAPSKFRKVGTELLLVDGTLYGLDADGGWIELGSPDSIDPDSGTTPDEYLAATRQDVGAATLRRITGAMTEPATTQLSDGSTVYRGDVAAELIARETGYKEGKAIRVLPFGYVAHDAAHDPTSLLDTAVTVGPEGIVREIAVRWGTWTYTVTYSDLGTGPAVVPPANARPFPDRTPGESPRPSRQP